MLLALALAIGCSSGGDGGGADIEEDQAERPPADDSDAAGSLVYAGTRYAIVAGRAEEYRSDNHSRADATFTDGAFFPLLYTVGNLTYTLWSTSSSKVEWYAELFSPGRDGFRYGTFDYVDSVDQASTDPAARSSFFFGSAYVGVDMNGNDQVDDDSELIDVVGGRIEVGANESGGVRVSLDLMLVNGERVTGSYDGAIALD